MKHSFTLFCIFFLFSQVAFAQSNKIEIETRDRILHRDVKRFGINLGHHDRYAAAQIQRNIISNPGFEQGEFNSIFIAETSTEPNNFNTMDYHTHWNSSLIGLPWNFFEDADFEFINGPNKGRKGKVLLFDFQNNKYHFQIIPEGPPINTTRGEILVVKQNKASLSRYGHGEYQFVEDSRPNGKGKHSVYVNQAAGFPGFYFFMDDYWRDSDISAGKLMQIKGAWDISIWVKGLEDNTRLKLLFYREGSVPFYTKVFELEKDEWLEIKDEFFVDDNDDPLVEPNPVAYRPILTFGIEAESGSLLADDVYLGKKSELNTPASKTFSDMTIKTLEELKPGILRNWSYQLGASLDNQLAEPFERKMHGFRYVATGANLYTYSLHEFLVLCKEIGAEPWYVVPPTFSTEEMKNLIEYLAAPANQNNIYADIRAEKGQEIPWTQVFSSIHLEYGYESWGGTGTTNSLQGSSFGAGYAPIAKDRIEDIRSAQFFDANKIKLTISGFLELSEKNDFVFKEAGTEIDFFTFAPYYGVLETWKTDSTIFYPLYATPLLRTETQGRMRIIENYLKQINPQTDLSIYENNLNTVDFVSPLDVRNPYLTSLAAGLALPLNMLTYLRELGIKNHCAHTLAEFSYRIADNRYPRVKGLMRDLEATGRKRPGFLGIELINKAVFGDMVQSTITTPLDRITIPISNRPPREENSQAEFEMLPIQSYSFYDSRRKMHSLIIFNLHLSNDYQLELGNIAYLTDSVEIYQLAHNNMYANNEDSLMVEIESQKIPFSKENFNFTLPKHSLTAFIWRDYASSVENQDQYSAKTLVYPNPADNQICFENIEFQSKIEIFDIRGNRVAEILPESAVRCHNISHLANGTYIYKTAQSEGKFIISR